MRPKGKLFALVVLFAAVGLLTATGAFTTVEADRTADGNVAGDSSALLALEQGHIDFEQFRGLLAEAIQAPTAFNIQNWRIVRVRDAAMRQQIREDMRQRDEELAAERRRLQQEQREAAEQRRLQGEQARYTAAIADTVEGHWRRPAGTAEGLEAVIRVSFSSAGDVRRIQVVDSSGNSSFDRSVERAVRAASPVPFPEEAALQERMQTITFRFAPDRS